MIKNWQDKTALVLNDRRVSYNEFYREIAKFSPLSKNLKNKKVAIYSENNLEWIFAFYSSWFNKNVIVPIDFMSTASEMAYIVDDSDVDVLFVSKDTYKVWEEAKAHCKNQPEVIVLNDIELEDTNEDPGDFPTFDKEDTALIIYTSGTTGSPKGVMLSYNNLLVNIEAVSIGVPIFRHDQEVLVLLPLHHILPLLGSVIATLNVGATCVMTPSLQSDDVMKTLADNKINIIIGVPRFYTLLIKGIKAKIDKSPVAKLLFKIASLVNSKAFSKKIFGKVHEAFGGHIEYLVCGGAAVDEQVERAMYTLGFEFLVGFGMTETAPMITFPRPGNTRLGSSGQALPGSDIQIIDDEVTIVGPQIMKGYYNKPKETADVIKDGRLYTGDLGYLDKDGFLFITGRRKEIIVTEAGKNINPVEIEFKLMDLAPAISEIGVYYEENTLKAVVYPNFVKVKEDEIINIEEYLKNDIIEKYNLSVSPYKRIRKIHIVKNELPKTRLGKLKRHKLADLHIKEEQGLNNPVDEPKFEEYTILKKYLEDEKKKVIKPNDHLEIDLGLDSLDTVGLQVFIYSTFGITITPELILENASVLKLSTYIKDKKTKIEVESVKWSEIFKEKLDIKLPSSWFTHSFLKFVSKIFFSVYFKIKKEGLEKLPEGPFILAPNHQSFFDGFFVAMFLKNKLFKKTYFYAKKKHFDKKFRRFIANTNNVIIVDINKDLKQSLQKMAEVLKNGKNLVIFPEGTRSNDGNLGDFKKTFAILSRELKVPIVPVAIDGAHEALPKGRWLPRPFKKISVKYLDPIYPDGHSYDSLKEKVYKSVASAIETAKNIKK